MSVGLPSGSVQIRRIIYSEESEPITPVFYDDIADVNTNVLVLDTVLEYDPLIRIQGYYWNGIRNVPIPNTPAFVLPQVASATLLLDLEADTLVLADGDPVSTWADQSGNGHNFTQTDPTHQPVFRPSDSLYPNDLHDPYIEFGAAFDGGAMVGGDFADALTNFAVFRVSDDSGLITKLQNVGCSDPGSTGWYVDANTIGIYTDASNYTFESDTVPMDGVPTPFLKSFECINGYLKVFVQNVENEEHGNGGMKIGMGASAFSNSEPVRINVDGMGWDCTGYRYSVPTAILIYEIHDVAAWNATDRTTVAEWLAARYGITL